MSFNLEKEKKNCTELFFSSFSLMSLQTKERAFSQDRGGACLHGKCPICFKKWHLTALMFVTVCTGWKHSTCNIGSCDMSNPSNQHWKVVMWILNKILERYKNLLLCFKSKYGTIYSFILAQTYSKFDMDSIRNSTTEFVFILDCITVSWVSQLHTHNIYIYIYMAFSITESE